MNEFAGASCGSPTSELAIGGVEPLFDGIEGRGAGDDVINRLAVASIICGECPAFVACASLAVESAATGIHAGQYMVDGKPSSVITARIEKAKDKILEK